CEGPHHRCQCNEDWQKSNYQHEPPDLLDDIGIALGCAREKMPDQYSRCQWNYQGYQDCPNYRYIGKVYRMIKYRVANGQHKRQYGDADCGSDHEQSECEGFAAC